MKRSAESRIQMQTRLLHSGIVIVGATIFPLLLIELTLHLFPVRGDFQDC
jgi:hypothetical protein